jgi:hypothetical protein
VWPAKVAVSDFEYMSAELCGRITACLAITSPAVEPCEGWNRTSQAGRRELHWHFTRGHTAHLVDERAE